MYRIFVLSLVLSFSFNLFAQQKPATTAEEFEAKYEWRIKQEYLDGTYIPKDLTDVFVQLNRLIDEPSKKKFTTASEEEVVRKLYFSLGRWMTFNWGLYDGSRLSVFLRRLEIYHPDDMVRFLITTYHRNLNKNPLDVRDLVEELQLKREQERAKRMEKGEVLEQFTRQPEPSNSGN